MTAPSLAAGCRAGDTHLQDTHPQVFFLPLDNSPCDHHGMEMTEDFKALCAGLGWPAHQPFLYLFFSDSNQIKSRKWNVSQTVPTALPLHVASRDLSFFLLTSKLGNILETENEIGTSASQLFWVPSPTLHIVLSVCLF